MKNQSPVQSGKSKTPAVFGVSVVALAIISSLHFWEGQRYVPYQDQVGVWTVCGGITGKDVIPGKTYTPEECDKLETAFVDRMLQKIGSCVTVPMTFNEWVAYGHFTYNIGTGGFCKSTLVKLLNQDKREQACMQMARWTFIKKNGVSVNCRDPKHKCGGLPKRRDFEVDTCLNTIP